MNRFEDQYSDYVTVLNDMAEDLWAMKFPHWTDTQDRADTFRASLLIDEAKSLLQELEMRLREKSI